MLDTYAKLGDDPPSFNVALNDADFGRQGAHTLDRHSPDVPLQRDPTRYLTALETVLADPPRDGTLSRMVAWDGNWVRDDPTDAGAIVFLREAAAMIRTIISGAPVDGSLPPA
jgi:hypothetical protein